MTLSQNSLPASCQTSQNSSYKTIFFDLDDTLIDFKDAEKKSLKSVYQQFYKPYMMEQPFIEKYHAINRNMWTLFEHGQISQSDIKFKRFQVVGETLPPLIDPIAVACFYEDQLPTFSSWLPGAQATVIDLRAHYQIGVITNGFSSTQQAKYKKFSMAEWCKAYIVSEEVMASKPDKKIFDIAMAQLNASPTTALMVGDSLSSDFQGSLNAGIDFCWMNSSGMPLPKNFPSPKFVISSVDELLNILSPSIISRA